jgi:hypothetical protein
METTFVSIFSLAVVNKGKSSMKQVRFAHLQIFGILLFYIS